MKKFLRAAVLAGLMAPLGILACFNVDDVSLNELHMANASLSPANRLRAVMRKRNAGHDIITAVMSSNAEGVSLRAPTPEAMAIKLVLRGEFAPGIAALEKLEASTPGRYSTAANLGTAYELSGDNRKALQWISEAIRRNPASHEGTEWLHELILQAKLQLAQNPAWLSTNRVVGIEAAQIKDPAYRFQAGARSLSMAEVEKALDYQLLERMHLVKPKDAVVADLLFTYALIEKQEGKANAALDLLGLSGEYGFAVPSLLKAQANKIQWAMAWADIPPAMKWGWPTLVALAGGYFCLRRKLFSRHSTT
jgi:tetratricopeptide (TPR) repeat protein